DGRVHVICRSGARSAQVAMYLVQQGLDAVNVDGGMQAWQDSGRAVVADGGAPGHVLSPGAVSPGRAPFRPGDLGRWAAGSSCPHGPPLRPRPLRPRPPAPAPPPRELPLSRGDARPDGADRPGEGIDRCRVSLPSW